MFECEQLQIEITITSVLSNIKEKYLNKDVIIPIGKFKGRKGKITYINHFDRIGMQIQPYRLIRRGHITEITDELLWDHSDARKFWPADKFKELELWIEN